ncbi:cupin domain-containing protein [Brevibacillus migulae]|uniref:cupin domain-containing protein n=1 Tax=Brevibacillus migulae TaxID=1644114 RepID=UPI001F26DB22|nr:cupin domain-containing protein [Brevibacillus migulae]
MKTMKGVNFEKELAEVTEYWSPRVVGRVNDQYLKVAKCKGEFVWHKHDNEDELFLVVYGQLRIEFEDGAAVLEKGDFTVVPKNTLHKPVADEECGIVLIETITTLHTGDTVTSLTKTIDQQLSN